MKLYTLLSTAAIFAVTFSVSAQAEDRPGFYIGLQGAVNHLQDADIDTGFFGNAGTAEYKTGYGLGVTGGYNFGNVRAEAEYTYRHNSTDNINGVTIDDSRVNSDAFMGNVYFDVPTGGRVTPYVGAGAGYAEIDADGTDGNFAYQGMAGLNFAASDKVTLYTGYKYFAISGDAKFDAPAVGDYSIDYKSHNVEAGVRFKL